MRRDDVFGTMGIPKTLGADVREKLLREFTSFVALIVGLGSGIAQLMGWTTGVGRVVFIGLCVISFLYLIVRFAVLFYVRRIDQARQERDDARRAMEELRRETREELAVQQVAHQSYVEAISRIIDQEGPIYSESLELTIMIGTADDGDMIVERRVTTPRPRVTQRAIRPIVPEGSDHLIGLDDIGLHCKIENIAGTITPRPLSPTGKPRVWLVFQPGLTETFTWQISYCSRGLWAPLRKRGSDYLIWNDRLPAGNGAKSVLSELTVRFVFPASDKAPTVHERHGFGRGSAAEPREGGWVVVWTDPEPAGHRYEWDLAQAR